MTMTYWLRFPRKFSNEYDVGIATTNEHAEQYEAEEFERIDRDYALRLMSRRPQNGEQLYVDVTIDGAGEADRYDQRDRYAVARAIRTGQLAA